MSPQRTTLLTALLLVALSPLHAHAMCGAPLAQNNFKRPLDYTDPADQDYVKNWVEQYHWTPGVENLTKGKSAPVQQDLAFILRQIPNHHRALNSMMNWQLTHPFPLDANDYLMYRIDCYFDRALTFTPNDPVLHVLQGIYFSKSKNYEDAERSYRRALDLDPDMAEAHYDLGLLLFDLGKFQEAKAEAQKAYALSYPLPGLRNRLARAGQW